MIRPVDTDTLQNVSRDIALDNFGFLYVNDHQDEIQTAYRTADTGWTTKGDLSLSDIESAMAEIADDDISSVQRRRNGVYYYDPFETREGSRVSDELKSIFTYDLVVNKQTLENRFDIAPTDVDFFASELESEGYIQRIATGDRDYYVSGSRLKDETSGDASVDSRLQDEATNGTISHADLESVIDVAATSDVIRFLEQNDFIVDLDDEYLVKSAMEQYAAHLAGEVGDTALQELGDIGVLPIAEFDQVLRNEVDAVFDVFTHLGRGDAEDLVTAVRDHLVDEHGLEVTRDLVVDPDRLDPYVEGRAEQILEEVESEHDLATPSEYREAGHPRIEEIEVSDTSPVNRHVRDAVTDQFDVLVEGRFTAETDA